MKFENSDPMANERTDQRDLLIAVAREVSRRCCTPSSVMPPTLPNPHQPRVFFKLMKKKEVVGKYMKKECRRTP